MFLTLSGSLRSIPVFRQRFFATISDKSFSTTFLSYPVGYYGKYFYVHQIIFKNNLYEHKNEINLLFKNWNCNLPFYHFVSLSVWSSIICFAIISKNTIAHSFISSMDGVCRNTISKFNHWFFFFQK